MVCCPNCFDHDWLKSFVDDNGAARGVCDYCESADVPLLEVGKLSVPFHNLLSMYVEAEDYETGELLINHIQWGWGIFDDRLGDDKQRSLLEEIANAGWDHDSGESRFRATDLYIPTYRQPFHTTHRDRWEQYCFDVRRDQATPIPLDEFLGEDLVKYQELVPNGTILYRARRGFTVDEYGGRIPYGGADIGAPPAARARAGRANVAGQVVLYTADQEKTAVAETRPALGFYVSVASVVMRREYKVLDLTSEPELNPFVLDPLSWYIEIQSLLRGFAAEMSRPLERDDDETYYVPHQRLSEFIRNAGFEGIRYPSALNQGGTNVVFFDVWAGNVGDSRLVRISETSFGYEDHLESA